MKKSQTQESKLSKRAIAETAKETLPLKFQFIKDEENYWDEIFEILENLLRNSEAK